MCRAFRGTGLVVVCATALAAVVSTTEVQAKSPVATLLMEVGKAIIGEVARRAIDSVWSRNDPEIRELRRELQMLHRDVDRLATMKGAPCRQDTATNFVSCIVDEVKRAHAVGRIKDADAVGLMRALGAVFDIGPGGPGAGGSQRPAFPGMSATPPPTTRARPVGPDIFCAEARRPDGTLFAGIVDRAGQYGEWIEIAADRQSAKLVRLEGGREASMRVVTPKRLKADRKGEFERRMSLSSPGASGLADGTGATVYYDGLGRETIYYGLYREGRRHGKGCYFGQIGIQPYCYRNDLRTPLPTSRVGEIDLSRCIARRGR